MKFFLILLSLSLFSVACSSPKEKYVGEQEEAQQEYDESMKEAQEEYKEEQKDEAVEYVDESEEATIDKKGKKVDVQE